MGKNNILNGISIKMFKYGNSLKGLPQKKGASFMRLLLPDHTKSINIVNLLTGAVNKLSIFRYLYNYFQGAIAFLNICV